MLFDTHLHLIYRDKLRYPWLADYAALNQDNPLDEYARKAAQLGISGCFHMEVDVAEDEIETEVATISDVAKPYGNLVRGIISSCRPEHDGFAAHLERATAETEVRGFRRVLHVVPDDVSQSSIFRDNVKRICGTGLTFDLCVLPRQLHLAKELVDHCPDVSFVLDHCGVPNIAGQEMEPWSADIRELSKRPNVHAKISGVIAYADPHNWTLDDIKAFVDVTVDAFGPSRLVWGSDHPVCNLGGGLPTWVALTHALTIGWSNDERTALYYQNAIDLWRLDG